MKVQTEFCIKPSAGLIVRDPITQRPLASEGETKPRNAYWLRRERDGDVEKTTKAKARKAVATKATQEK